MEGSSSEIKDEYTSSLQDLTFNSKPLISVLTILAEENVPHAKDIVQAIEEHLTRVRTEVKLPVLYLIDCIIKNVGGQYTSLFCQNIVSTFCSVFEKVDERTRAEMFRLRQTWNDVIPAKKLYALDVQIKHLDPAWPVTATPPSSIHFNPKFLKTTTTTVSSSAVTTSTVAKSSTAPLITTNSTALDPKTISMHQKLIDKQRELLELQQRKLELELLQTQVKLQEQLKTQTVVATTASTVPTLSPSQNLLLKPEVAKQMAISTGTNKHTNNATNVKSKIGGTHVVSSVMNSKFQNNTASGGPRIAPVSSSLANARPIRDPRLLRHQQLQQQHQSSAATVNSNVHLDKSGTQVTVESDNNKIVNNKFTTESHGKSKTLPNSSPLKRPQKIDSSLRKTTSKFSRDTKLSSNSLTDLTDTKSSSSSVSSPSKNSRSDSSQKNRSSSSKSSPVKSKKKSSTTRSNRDLSKDSTSSSRYDKSGASTRSDKDNSTSRVVVVDKKSDKHSKSIKSDKESKSHKSESTAFKELKGTTKNRNYIRRNRNTSASPEPNQDVDLRLTVPPPEKQSKIQTDNNNEKNTTIDLTAQNMDVDLRQLPTVIGKRRSSPDTQEAPTAKKSKSEMFDVLFGNEDTDLRQLPIVVSPSKSGDRPPTPPPPIISEKLDKSKLDNHDNNTDVTLDKKEVPSKNLSLDAVRVKLANAIHKDKLKGTKELDTDLRCKLPSFTNQRDAANMNKIIISPADEECIKTGNMTKAQETALMNKIIAQIETQKLREAQRKECENVNNISLQPISDDELDPDFSGNESDETAPKKLKDKSNRSDKTDDRVPPIPIPPLITPPEGTFSKYPWDADHRDPRRAPRIWRGRSTRKGWDNVPMIGPIPRPGIRPNFRSGPEPWIRPMYDSWRPTGPGGINPKYPNIPPLIPNDQNDFSAANSGSQDIPALEYAHPDANKFITIDNKPREIRYYDETAIVFMSAGDPREITFHNGIRRIFFDGEPYTLHLNSPYEDIFIKGNKHQVRLGAPSREIFIDGKGYECYFDEKEKTIELDGNTILVKLEPPPPQVKIGQQKRLDLVAGKIQLVVDAKNMFTVFLDAKVQTFEIDGVANTLKFIDSLKAVLINDVRFDIEYGGLPKPIILQNKKHFIRFSVLPKGIRPGYIRIKDMEDPHPYISPRNEDETSQDSQPTFNAFYGDQPASAINKRFEGDSPERNSNSPYHFQSLMPNQNLNNLDMLSSVIASSIVPNSDESGYKVEDTAVTTNLASNLPTTIAPSTTQPTVTPALDIANLFQRLVATGIVTTVAPTPPEDSSSLSSAWPLNPSRNINVPNVKPATFSKPETLKIRRAQSIQSLYQGIQCSSCGMRFPPGQDNYYKLHLDWHFRQNRRGKKNNRKTSNRRWYYTFCDWKSYEEIEDLEEREKNYFENQQLSQGDGLNDEGEEEFEIPCAPADPNVPNAACEVCQDKFEQFYNEEKEEWQLRMAIRVDDKTYHPLCYEDYQASLVDLSFEENKTENATESNTIPGLEMEVDKQNEKPENEEDDIMEVIENIDDEDNSNTENKSEEVIEKVDVDDNSKTDNMEEDDDDVIINEVVPEKIVVDDDNDDKDDYISSGDGLIPGVVVKQEPIDDGFVDVENGLVRVKSNQVKIKTEPIDPDEIGVIASEEPKAITETPPTTHIDVVASIDGNVEFDSSAPPTATGIGGKIKINITKSLPAIVPRENKDVSNDTPKGDNIDPSQPLPPGEEPVQLNRKPALQGLELKRLPTVKKGSELTGLCSIM